MFAKSLIILLLLFQNVLMGPQRKIPSPSGGTPVGLLDEWPMNEGSGTTFFDLAPVNPTNVPQHNPPVGSYGTVSGWPPNAFTFSGSDGGGLTAPGTPNYVQNGLTPFSVCAWVNPSTLPAIDAVVSGVDPIAGPAGWALSVNSGNVVASLINNQSSNNQIIVTSTGTISIGVNSQICFTYHGSPQVASGVKIYINGSLASSTPTVDNLSGGIQTNKMGLGVIYNGVGVDQHPFVGVMGYASVWSCELSSTVINNNHTAGPSFTGLHC